jgi:hypothetical protein
MHPFGCECLPVLPMIFREQTHIQLFLTENGEGGI